VSQWSSLRESKNYSEQLAKIGDVCRLDDALSGVYWGIARSPSSFPSILGDIRIAKIRTLDSPDGPVDIRIWFVEVSENEIELLAIHAQKTF
jgi:hypothetical protein